jgi:hypothetical protein
MLKASGSWGNSIATTVSRNYDDNLRVVAQAVEGTAPVSFEYDDDGTPVCASSWAVRRHDRRARRSG